ncbi:molybdenum cofactor biosynthesis protein MoaE [cyanobiont of Ornithocercus magnificus]|nr:molybdenum cofactor biosynthesis protein MoaE [cyanobiont of Ornithocercus magnificus]
MSQKTRVLISSEAFSPWESLDNWLEDAAASAIFIGRVRDQSWEGNPLQTLELTHYPGMCERQIHMSAEVLLRKHKAISALVVHRVGQLVPGEVILLVAVAADHRGQAQRCCTALLESLKHEAPFWKRECCDSRSRWLTDNTEL